MLGLVSIIGVLLSLSTAVSASAHGGEKGEKPATVYGIFTPECYVKFSAGDVSDMDCVKFSFSKLIGFLIITGSFILKVPQISKILSAGSADGVGILPLYLESFNFAITAATSIHLGLAFSVYGETLTIIA